MHPVYSTRELFEIAKHGKRMFEEPGRETVKSSIETFTGTFKTYTKEQWKIAIGKCIIKNL